MSFVVGILTFLLVLNCLLLILLVLVQLPKKDAGAGMAFGAGAADALFGAGSGNALTKITKYTAGIFLGLSLLLGGLQSHIRDNNSSAEFLKLMDKKQQTQTPITVPAQAPKAATANNLLSTLPVAISNTAAAAATNSAK